MCALDATYQDEHMAGLFDSATLAASSVADNPLQYPLADPDPLMSTPLTDSRKAFLGVCQHLHLQFDTRRNAKYSTMLLLHRLLHPALPAAADEVFVCSVCQAVVLKSKHWLMQVSPLLCSVMHAHAAHSKSNQSTGLHLQITPCASSYGVCAHGEPVLENVYDNDKC